MGPILHLIDAETPLDMRNQLAALAGEDDRIVSIGPPPADEDRLNVQRVHVPVGMPAPARLWLHRVGGRPELVHAWSDRAHQAGAALAAKHACPLVRSLPVAPPPTGVLVSYNVSVEGRTVWTVPTEAARQKILARGLPPERVGVLPPAAEAPDQPAQRRQRMRESLEIGPDALVILAGGEMIRPAGHKIAGWVHGILRYVHDDLPLVFPDGGPIRESVFYFSRGAGFGDDIHGPWPPSERPDSLAAADVAMICPQRDCGTTHLAEALAAGLPTVIFPTPDLTECGGQAVLAAKEATPRSAAQAVLKLMEDASLRADLASAARQQAQERFAPATIRRALREIYRQPAPARS